jgi:glutathione S-transferase
MNMMNMNMGSSSSMMSGVGIFGSVLRGVNIDDYKWVALVASLMMFQLTINAQIPGSRRGKVFSKEFTEANIKPMHEESFTPGTSQHSVPKSGYPDMGMGRYAEKLSYKDWFSFNAAQRVHYHYLESATSVVCWLLIAGLLYPWVAVGFGGGYILGRILFTIGYMQKGPRGRVIGFILCQITATVLFAFSLVSPIEMAVKWNDYKTIM